MATVIDASVMVAFLLRNEDNSRYARRIVERLDREELIVPRIFWYEVRNVLLKAKRNNRIGQQDFEACLIQLTDEISPTEDGRNDDARTLDLALRHNLTVYDASYLETAIRHKAKLATFDQRLTIAASQERIENPAVEFDA